MTGNDIDKMSQCITDYIDKVIKFLEERDLQVSPEKFTVALLTNDKSQFNMSPPAIMKSKQVKLEKEPKILGVHFDTMFTFSKHVTNTVNKAKNGLMYLKPLLGSG